MTFFDFRDIILNPAGNIYKKKGYINPITKLETESVIKICWVFSYTAQKAEIKYQKNENKKKEKIKKMKKKI